MNSRRRGWAGITTFGAAFLLQLLAASPSFAARFAVTLDNGTAVTVDNVSAMSQAVAWNLVLAADRSTQTGCPYSGQKKGLMKTGDRVFVGDNYIAWFDYTLTDGVPNPADMPGPASFPRSGSLAGLWTLDPATQLFKHFYGGNGDPANNICWNWPRNELIPGSNSPTGRMYWWDRYAPALENTIVVATGPGANDWDFFSTNYPQANSASGFALQVDGVQDAAGVHYRAAGTMTSWSNKVTYPALNASHSPTGGTAGKISYSVEYICAPDRITVQWKFSPTVTAYSPNLYIDFWAAYAGVKNPLSPTKPPNSSSTGPGLYQTQTCTKDKPSYRVAAPVLGLATQGTQNPYHDYNFVQSNITLKSIDRFGQGTDTNGQTVAFPWSEAEPCNGDNLNVGVYAMRNSGATAIQAGDWLRVGYAASLDPAAPFWQLTNLLVPDSGSGTSASPRAIPFTAFMAGYENTDQQQSILMSRPGQWITLQASTWYQVQYAISTRPIDPAAPMVCGNGSRESGEACDWSDPTDPYYQRTTCTPRVGGSCSYCSASTCQIQTRSWTVNCSTNPQQCK